VLLLGPTTTSNRVYAIIGNGSFQELLVVLVVVLLVVVLYYSTILLKSTQLQFLVVVFRP
jgi:hypothetical protein